MRPGLSDDLQQVKHDRKTAIIDRELATPNIDIAALQETRLCRQWQLQIEGVHILLTKIRARRTPHSPRRHCSAQLQTFVSTTSFPRD
ncbi:hypothetical protein ElyMa_006059700 [Elysia marginata]|uniref:Endonuclease/exonuclease/phosphatase domain-containing protein n=1 Tax=Elysia marginata TaxID=1093978 RepID=A0AAV4GN01_9GAST|nr:hypothetical protein ElyMa_006059700 [Elysia marginata]